MKYMLAIFTAVLFSISCHAFNQSDPVIFIGGSYAKNKVNFNEGMDTPLFGIATESGDYLDLGQAFSQRNQLIVNEAWAGDTTFGRGSYIPVALGGGTNLGNWPGMEVQLQRAFARSLTTAKYVVIDIPNDCLHANAFGVPQEQTSPCVTSDFNAVVDRFIALGETVEAAGMTAVYNVYPSSSDLDLATFGATPLLLWVIDNAGWEDLRSIHMTRIAAEMPNALLVDCYKNMEHIGDGLHPDALSMKRCAQRDLNAMEQSED